MKNIQLKSTKLLIISLGTSGIFTKPRKVQISHVSNGPPTEKEFQELLTNFKSKLPYGLPDIQRKNAFMSRFLNGNLSEAQIEEMLWKTLEQKLRSSKLSQVNVPYEKERLRAEIESFERKISKQMNQIQQKTVVMSTDALLKTLRLKQQRLKKLMARIEELEEQQDAKMKMEFEMEYKELSHQENIQM